MALQNEQGPVLRPVLKRLEDLRREYGSLRKREVGRCEEALRQVLAALHDPLVRRALDPLLERELSASRSLTHSANVIDREAKLGQLFGFNERQMKSYIRAARETGHDVEALAIRETLDLERFLIENHEAAVAEAKSAIDRPLGKRRKAARYAQRRAERGVYCAGLIVADGLYRRLFPHSYAFATRTALGAET